MFCKSNQWGIRKNVDFECRYIRIHTKEKPSKISKITFAIFLFIRKKVLKLNGQPEYFRILLLWYMKSLAALQNGSF